MWRIALACLVGFALVSCGSPKAGHQQSSSAPSKTQATATGVWSDATARAKVTAACFGEGHPGTRACVRTQMQSLGAPQDVRDFFDASGEWLLGVMEGPGKLKPALVVDPAAKSPIPQVAFLGDKGSVQEALALLQDAFPTKSDESFRPFDKDPMYPALLAAAQRKFAGADDPIDLKHFDIEQLESSATTPAGGQSFVVEVGIHNYCADCGVGVAASYAFDFDSNGKSTGVRLLGLCQGRQVTQDIQGFGKATFHEFSSVAAGKAGVTEEDLLTVPGLSTCPEHLSF